MPTERVQPIVHIDREQTEVRQVLQPVTEKEVKPTQVTQKTTAVDLGTRYELPTNIPKGSNVGAAPNIESQTEFLGVERRREEFKPIVKETVHKTVIEEVIPVVEREVVVPHVIEQTKHIHEEIKEKPVVTHEIREPISAEQWAKSSLQKS